MSLDTKLVESVVLLGCCRVDDLVLTPESPKIQDKRFFLSHRRTQVFLFSWKKLRKREEKRKIDIVST